MKRKSYEHLPLMRSQSTWKGMPTLIVMATNDISFFSPLKRPMNNSQSERKYSDSTNNVLFLQE